jgi:hypothetical protein
MWSTSSTSLARCHKSTRGMHFCTDLTPPRHRFVAERRDTLLVGPVWVVRLRPARRSGQEATSLFRRPKLNAVTNHDAWCDPKPWPFRYTTTFPVLSTEEFVESIVSFQHVSFRHCVCVVAPRSRFWMDAKCFFVALLLLLLVKPVETELRSVLRWRPVIHSFFFPSRSYCHYYRYAAGAEG